MPHICTSKLPVYSAEDIHYVVVACSTQGTLVMIAGREDSVGGGVFCLGELQRPEDPFNNQRLLLLPSLLFSSPRHQFQRIPQ